MKNVPQASWWRSSSASKDLLGSSSWWHFAFLVHLGQLLPDLWHVPSGSATFFCLTLCIGNVVVAHEEASDLGMV